MSDSCKTLTCSDDSTMAWYLAKYNFQGSDYVPPSSPETINCKLVDCIRYYDLAGYFGQFNFQSGVVYTFTLYPTGGGSGTYYQIQYPTSPSVISYQGCLSTVTASVPAGATQAEINAIAEGVFQQITDQQAQCDLGPGTNPGGGGTTPVTPPPGPPSSFTNTEQIIDYCPDLFILHEPSPWPTGISYDSGLGTLIVAAGLFAASSQDAADLAAYTYGENYLIAQVGAGNFICACPIAISDLAWSLNSSLSYFSFNGGSCPAFGECVQSGSSFTITSDQCTSTSGSGYINMQLVFDAKFCPNTGKSISLSGSDISCMASQTGWSVGGYGFYIEVLNYPALTSHAGALIAGNSYLLRITCRGQWVAGGTGPHQCCASATINYA